MTDTKPPKDMTDDERRSWETKRKRDYRARKKAELLAQQEISDARPEKTRDGQPKNNATPEGRRKGGKKGGAVSKARRSIEKSRKPNHETVKAMKAEINQRLDKRHTTQPLSPEFKLAIQDTYAANLGLDAKALAKACGISVDSVWSALQEAPSRYHAAREKRRLATTEELEQGLAELSYRFKASVEAGELDPTAKNMRDWSVMFGIMTDKLRLMTGQSTDNVEVRSHMTIEDRKARLGEVLERAGRVIDAIGGGNGSGR